MPKRTSKTKELSDPVQNAYRVVQESILQTETVQLSLVSQVMAEMGRKGGKIGGKRRLETMTSKRRSQVARKAAKTRWANAKKNAKTA